MAARVHHQRCLSIFDFGQENGVTFMAMEYFPSRTLKEVLLSGRLVPRTALRIAQDVAKALRAVHEAGIVHRDVKPANILLDQRASVRLTDFGVAKALSDDVDETGMMVGTLRYMAPEQARGGPTDHRVDLFALGAVLHEMLAGRAPFGATVHALIERADRPPPGLPEELDISDGVRSIVQRCLEPLPERRFPSAGALVQALHAVGVDDPQHGDDDRGSQAVVFEAPTGFPGATDGPSQDVTLAGSVDVSADLSSDLSADLSADVSADLSGDVYAGPSGDLAGGTSDR